MEQLKDERDATSSARFLPIEQSMAAAPTTSAGDMKLRPSKMRCLRAGGLPWQPPVAGMTHEDPLPLDPRTVLLGSTIPIRARSRFSSYF